jgi:hypothetical protein
MIVDSNVTVPFSEEDELNVILTGSPRPSPTVSSPLAKDYPCWVSNLIQTLIMNSIDWKELCHGAVRDDSVSVVCHDILKDDTWAIIEKKIIKNTPFKNVLDLERSTPCGCI